MAEPHEKSEKKSLGAELVIPVAALAFTLYYFWTITDVPWVAQVSAVFVGTILIILLIIFFIRTGLAVHRGEADLRIHDLLEPRWFLPRRLALFGLTLGYIVVIRWLGFTVTTFLFLMSAMLLLGEGRRKSLIVALTFCLALGGYFLFVVAFETRFPEGAFERIMKGLI